MSLGIRARTMVLVGCLGQGLAACGQDTSDHLDFALRSVSFEVWNQNPQWRASPSVPVPNIVCAGPQALGTDCCKVTVAGSPLDCQQYPFACDPWSNYCALTFDMAIPFKVDLVAAVPEVAAVDDRAFAEVVLSSLTSTITGLDDLPIRAADLYVGPQTLASPADAAATWVASLPLLSSTTTVAPSPAGRQAFSAFARDYRNPFGFLLALHVVVANGTVPAGLVTFALSATARASY